MYTSELQIVEALNKVEREANLIDLYGASITRLQGLRSALEELHAIRKTFKDELDEKIESNPTLKDIYKL